MWLHVVVYSSFTPQHNTSCCSQEYEKLAAQLDGARAPLAKKVQNFSGMNNTKHLVELAEEHAELLNTLAMNLSR